MDLIRDEQVEQFRELGYFVVEPQWSLAELDEVLRVCQRLHADRVRDAEASGDARRAEFERLRPFIGQAHSRSDVLARFAKSPIYMEACRRFVGADADLYYNQVVIKAPEKGMQFGWHQDSGYMRTVPLEYITCWTAISRSTLENGCIWVIPGSHKRGLITHARVENTNSTDAVIESEEGAIPVEMERGQVAIFSSLTLHKSGPNVSREPRVGYVPQYHVPNLRRADNGELFGDQYPVLRGGLPV